PGRKLQRAMFSPSYADLPPLRKRLEQLLAPEGRIVELNERRNFVVVEGGPGQIDTVQKFLTQMNVRAAEKEGAILPPDMLQVAREEAPEEPAEEPATVSDGERWDPTAAFTTYKSRPPSPSGTIGAQVSHTARGRAGRIVSPTRRRPTPSVRTPSARQRTRTTTPATSTRTGARRGTDRVSTSRGSRETLYRGR
ncbi:unnamed protein product, partial [marine sediment metagenome]